jgi:hypothetical protein
LRQFSQFGTDYSRIFYENTLVLERMELEIKTTEDGDDDEVSHYFGNKARENFFEHYKWLNHQSEISLPNLKAPLDASYFSHVHEYQQEMVPTPVGTNPPFRLEPVTAASNRKQGIVSEDGGEPWSLTAERYSPHCSPSITSHSPVKKVYTYNSSPTKSKIPKSKIPTPKPTLPALALHTSNRTTPVENGSLPGSKNISRGPSPNTTILSPLKSPPGGALATGKHSIPEEHHHRHHRLYLHPAPVPHNKYDHDDLFTISADDENPRSLVNGDFNVTDTEHPEDLQAISPRTRFLASCIKEQLNPRPSLLLRKKETTKLDLKHQGMNDSLAKAFAKSLQSLPDVDSINIADNRLTDIGLTPILQAILDLSTLKELNLSQNILGPAAAKALHHYLSKKDCPLERLVLNSSNVDDLECAHFIHAIEKNGNLLELDLSQNEIGKNEKAFTNTGNSMNTHHSGPLQPIMSQPASQSNSVNNSRNNSRANSPRRGSKPVLEALGSPNASHNRGRNLPSPLSSPSPTPRKEGGSGAFTGPHAIANLLRSALCKLMKLNLQWNLIRLDGAVDLSSSLSVNKTLVFLDLSYNSLATEGSMALGMALLKNTTLEHLNISFNSIDSMGCVTLCAGIMENRSLKKVILDGNPIGETVKTRCLSFFFSCNSVFLIRELKHC